MANEIDGLHLIVDGLVESPKKVFSEKNLKALMLRLVEDLDMQLIWGPKFKRVKLEPTKLTGDVFQDEGGISGVCMIGTSHISVHVWPLRRFVHMDVFSCKTFDERKAVETIHEFLQPEAINVQSVRRSQNDLLPISDPKSAQRKGLRRKDGGSEEALADTQVDLN
jgi:S-adenosylmethionine decarboxylase